MSRLAQTRSTAGEAASCSEAGLEGAFFRCDHRLEDVLHLPVQARGQFLAFADADSDGTECGYNGGMKKEPLAGWSPEQIAAGRRWVQGWKEAGLRLDRVRREELRRLDPQRAIALLCGEADYTRPPRAPRPTSGLIEQQRWFMRAASRRA